MKPKINDNIILTYYPNRRNLFLLPLFVLAGVLSIWCEIDLFLQGDIPSIITSILVIGVVFVLCCLCSIIFYVSAQQCVFCSANGLYVQFNGYKMPEFISFSGEYKIYETTNIQGHIYYVFSKTCLSTKQARKMANKSSLLMKMKVEYAFVVWDNSSSDAKQFAQILKSNMEK